MKIVENIKVSINIENIDLRDVVSKNLKVSKESIKDIVILKRSIDARKKPEFIYKLAVLFDKQTTIKLKHLTDYKKEELNIVKTNNPKDICVVGFGPSSIFASLILSLKGHNVTVFEAGADVDKRIEKVEEFFNSHKLDETTNVQFGEGGAGTFSDGKLNTRTKSPYNNFVLETFVKYGADESILYVNNPHVGTDVLRSVVKNIRLDLISNGVKINFLSKVEKFNVKDNLIESITVNDKEYSFDKYILGLGNSARSTFRHLFDIGVNMESKSIACGFRVEHLQKDIDKNQYKEHFDSKALGAAEYKLTNGSRNCYTFCMCPGGYVVNAASEKNTNVTNGMSYFARDAVNANSAIIVGVEKTSHPLGLIEFQESIEKKCFELTSSYDLPVMNIQDFVNQKQTTKLAIKPSVISGTKISDLSNIYSKEINNSIRESLVLFDKKIKGFLNGIIIGVETRSSSPVRILRDEEYKSNITNLYPIGEGAGYAGGITSSAIDGVKVSLTID